MPEDAPAAVELERLRRENEALNQQIKLLVQAEQRLCRSQNELDAQLVRIRALARFELETSATVAPGEILGLGLDVLAEAFTLEGACIVRLEPNEPAVTLLRTLGEAAAPPVRRALDRAAWDWLRALAEPCCLPLETADEQTPLGALMRALRPVAGPACLAPTIGEVALAPLRSVGGAGTGLLVACTARHRLSHSRPDALTRRQLPFLRLLAHHIERAVESAVLTESLRERSAELAASLAALEQTQQELLQAQKLEAVGRLAGGIAHDFNNLLTVILGYAGTMQCGLPSESPHQENVRLILEAAQRAAATVRQLLAHGRRQIQRPEDLDLSEQAQRTVDLVRRLVGEDVRLALDLDRALAPVRADRSQIEQVLLNLVVNARDAMPDGGTMCVVTRRARPADTARCDGAAEPGGFAVLEVEDTGVGMDSATRARIFEPFFTTKRPGQGTGLGLAVVYGIVKQSGGHILVDSTPGAGSRFTVLLPLAQGEAAAASAPSPARAVDAVRGVVVVVEDEPAIRRMAAIALREAGLGVIESADGAEALERIARERVVPDLLLTDIVMPRLGGVALARELRRAHPALRVAFMSGHSEDLLAEGGPGAAGARFLPKPFTPRQLLDFVAAALAEPAARAA